jgi:CRP/FNR family transcriptional regulator
MAGPSIARKLISAERAAAVAQFTSNAFEMAALKRLGGIGSRRSFDPGQILFLEGDRARSVFIVAEGCIKLYKMLLDGRRQITAFLFRGDFLGLPVRGGRYVFTAEALTCARVFSVTMERIERLLDSSPEFARKLMAFVFDELAFAQDQILLLGRKTALERVASFLLVLSRRQRAKGGRGDRIKLPMHQIDIADYLGIRHETVSRVLATLRRGGAIGSVASDHISIESGVRLVALAGFEDEPKFVAQFRDFPWGSEASAACLD